MILHKVDGWLVRTPRGQLMGTVASWGTNCPTPFKTWKAASAYDYLGEVIPVTLKYKERSR